MKGALWLLFILVKCVGQTTGKCKIGLGLNSLIITLILLRLTAGESC